MKPDDFGDFFEALHGQEPFPWQERLAIRVASGKPWPRVLSLPTASGKTACIDIALFALACQAEDPERTAPRRIFSVIDRRVVVDQTYRRAAGILAKLKEAKKGILHEVSGRLARLSGGEEPFVCLPLRGGIYRDDAWVRTPLQAAVIASTVDQIGSRLLFRGYGLRTGSMAPVHAGLVANDALILLDEAHCSRPFLQTLQAVDNYRKTGTNPVSTPFAFVALSATPPLDTGAGEVFRIDDADRRHPVLGRRLEASKPTKLVEATEDSFVDACVNEALGLVSGTRKAIGIMVNYVQTARRIHERLVEKRRRSVLLTGRMRPIDRDDASMKTLASISTGHPRDLVDPLFVVSTQCLEVGADVDFDALVTECASLDALRQRFGRLNRNGREDVDARGVIVFRKKTEDPIYGDALKLTWEAISTKAKEGKDGKKKKRKTLDMGILALDTAISGLELSGLLAPAPNAPVLLPSILDGLVQTSPVPAQDPYVAPYLHGIQRGVPDVFVCWRKDLEASRPESDWVKAVSLCPPTSIECLPVPIFLMRRWLYGESGQDTGDVEGSMESQNSHNTNGSAMKRTVLRWAGPENSGFIDSPWSVRPGDTLVIPAFLDGRNELGCVPPNAELDVGDLANWKARKVPVLRLLDAPVGLEDPEAAREYLEELVRKEQDSDTPREWFLEIADHLLRNSGTRILRHPLTGIAFQGRFVPGKITHETFTTEDDTASVTRSVTMEDHLYGVKEKALEFARSLGLPGDLCGDIGLAGLLHDSGKAFSGFQGFLHGGLLTGEASGTVLAKSDHAAVDRKERFLPKGWRHELLSVRLAESAEDPPEKDHDLDLVLHLIASHHGRCRPFAPIVNDTKDETVNIRIDGMELSASSVTGLERLDSGVAERFWGLVRRYGWWGLAYLEAILRLADHRRSEEEQRGTA